MINFRSIHQSASSSILADPGVWRERGLGGVAHVVMCAERNTSLGLLTLIHSIVTNSVHHVHFHVITTPDDQQHIKQLLTRAFNGLQYTARPCQG